MHPRRGSLLRGEPVDAQQVGPLVLVGLHGVADAGLLRAVGRPGWGWASRRLRRPTDSGRGSAGARRPALIAARAGILSPAAHGCEFALRRSAGRLRWTAPARRRPPGATTVSGRAGERAGNLAPSHALTRANPDHGDRRRSSDDSVCRRGSQPTPVAPRPRDRPAEAGDGDRQVARRPQGRALRLGTSLAPVRGPCGMLPRRPCARHSRGGVRGSTRPAPDGRSPSHPAAPSTGAPSGRPHLSARPSCP
jgi:hypothetical protein